MVDFVTLTDVHLSNSILWMYRQTYRHTIYLSQGGAHFSTFVCVRVYVYSIWSFVGQSPAGRLQILRGVLAHKLHTIYATTYCTYKHVRETHVESMYVCVQYGLMTMAKQPYQFSVYYIRQFTLMRITMLNLVAHVVMRVFWIVVIVCIGCKYHAYSLQLVVLVPPTKIDGASGYIAAHWSDRAASLQMSASIRWRTYITIIVWSPG